MLKITMRHHFTPIRMAMIKNNQTGNSLACQWLGLRALTAEGPGSIPGWGT